jgi:4-methyl-5(b-hydroxyethyl)-thiazole monophosphate biosynthesis
MKGILVLSNNIEDGEALTTRALLRRAGLDVVTITYEKKLDIVTAFGLNVKADYFGTDIQQKDYDFVVIPGGRYVSQVVDQDTHIKALVKSFHDQKKCVAAICAGPRFLGQAGILDGIHFTAFTGSEKDMPKGIYHPEKKSIRDHHIITARGAGAVYEFVYEIVSYLMSEEKAKALLNQILF